MKHLLFILFIFICSCSKDDNSPKQISGGNVQPLEVVKVDLTGFNLTKSEYQGNFGDSPVTVMKGMDNQVYFGVPADFLPGSAKLTIEGINVEATYTVLPAPIIANPDSLLQDFQIRLADYCSTADSTDTTITPVVSAKNSFAQIFQNASAADKMKMAQYYQANFEMFKTALDINYAQRYSYDVERRLINIKAEIVICLASAYTIIYSPDPVTKELATVIGIASGAKIFYDMNLILLDETIHTINTVIDGIEGDNNRMSSTSLEVYDFTSKVFTLSTKDRTFVSGDINSANTGTALFFANGNTYNDILSKINPIIQWLNANVPFCSFTLLPEIVYPAQGVEATNAVENESFSHFTFSISDPSVELSQLTFSGSGQISIKVKVKNASASFPVQTQLKYTYSDDYSTISGSFPLIINEGCVGVYNLDAWLSDQGNWTAPGIYIDNVTPGNCGQVMDAKTYTNGSLTLTETGSFSYQATLSRRAYNIIETPDTTDAPCTLTDMSDTYNTFFDNASGTYTISGQGQIILNTGSGTLPVSFANGLITTPYFKYRK